jgi:AcrR family transcriptional regulator
MDAKHSLLTAGRRELTKAQNRETILLAARQVFAELGFATSTVRDIIRATPLASGTFYNYFKSKEEVYLALRDREALALRPKLRQARRAAATPAEFLADSFRAFFWFVAESQDPPNRFRSGRFRMDSPEVLAGFAELREDVETAQTKGLFPAVDASQLSAALTGVAFELAVQVKTGAGVEEATAFATALFLGGLPALPKKRP